MGSSQISTGEWKSLFPISSVFKPPLLLSNPSLKPILGPLIFNPKPNSTTLLFSSSSSLLAPLPPLPHLSLPRFLLTSPPDSAPLPSSVPSVASFLGPHHPKSDVSSSLLYNRLQFLQCPQINTVVVFFPTGENSDQVGFLQLVLKGSTFDVKVDENGGVFASRRWFSYRISRISVNPILGFSSLRVVCDVRKPLMPVLQWAHGLDKPSYVDVLRLSELRSQSRDDKFNWASDSGFCIIVGSFWNCEFSIFCYGPSLPAPIGSVASKIAELRKSFYAWELPSDLLLSGHECHCGSCLVKEEFSKDALPEWIDWQQKKEIVLGFGIVNKDLSALLSEPDEFGGFTLIRLMSSGKLELQRYCASFDSVQKVEESHGEHLLFKDYLLYSPVDEEYKFPRTFKYLKLDYLCGYLNGNLDEVLDDKIKIPYNDQGKELFSSEFHETLCKKLDACGFGKFRSSPAVTSVLNDISLPASIHEVVLKRLWSDLPIELLQLAFSNNSEILEVLVDKNRVALEFSVVPDLSQLPPFILRKSSCRSNKWSQKVQPGDALVGPVLPLPVLLALHEYRNGCPNSDEKSGRFSVEAEINRSCDEVMQVTGELAVSISEAEIVNNPVTSLANDGDETWRSSQKSKPFFSYQPVAAKGSQLDHTQGKSVYKDDRFDTLISKVSDKKHVSNGNQDNVGLELFDDLCPVELRFDASSLKFEQKELEAYSKLKGEFLKWQKSFDLYQEFCSRIESKSS
ncbi:uncharacterized protein LOC117619670 [Prunus dulcis]|uniref:uncharacterized protein LOC117619670 n=1 Tax=Prunus dulcis TaxID=3755 RepID=UPI001482A783|nr:uncharacterized protein LOC117619670 [Prunus dulcis]